MRVQQTDRQTDRQTERQTETDRQKDRKTHVLVGRLLLSGGRLWTWTLSDRFAKEIDANWTGQPDR